MEPFGTQTPRSFDANAATQGPFRFNLRFPGQYYDSETALHYNINRYYDPSTGRYLQADPIGLGGGLNRYAYAGGDPMNFIDPLGLRIWSNCETGGFFQAVAEMGLGELYQEFNGYGRLDLGYSAYANDTFRIFDRTYNAREFANVLAGYAGAYNFGSAVGGAVVRYFGRGLNALHNPPAARDNDRSSVPYINLGVTIGTLQREGGSPLLEACVCVKL
jgi:RHS repeat-associated protein